MSLCVYHECVGQMEEMGSVMDLGLEMRGLNVASLVT